MHWTGSTVAAMTDPGLQKVLVHVTGDRIGDALLKLPSLRAFRAATPNAHVTWVTARRPSVFAGRLKELSAGLIDKVYAETGFGLSWFGAIPAHFGGRYDVVVSTEARLRETLVLRRLNAAKFISPAASFLFSAERPSAATPQDSVVDHFNCLMSLACGYTLIPDTTMPLKPAYVELAASLLPSGPRYFGLCPGAGGQSKRWPFEKFIALADQIASRGFTPVFFLGPEEADLVDSIRAQAPQALFPEFASGGTDSGSPLLTIALAQRLALSVTNDSGGGHLLAAGGQPVITLFGHTNSVKFRSPYCEQFIIHARDVANGVLADIGVDTVLAQVNAID